MKRSLAILLLLSLACSACDGQITNVRKMTTNDTTKNALICDPATGACEIPGSTPEASLIDQKTNVPLRLLYFTDPICSSCWGIEPQLRRLKLEYGSCIAIEYHMGGLLPDWSYNSGGISKPSDVAHHWDEVSAYYDMPIDGDVWLEDPLPSSYPPSIAFKAAQLQDEEKARTFLRSLRELVFLQKRNICKWEFIEAAALSAGLNTDQLKSDYESRAIVLFQDDLKLAKARGVRGFPTIFMINRKGEQEMIYGSRPYATYESAIKQLYPEAKKNAYYKDMEVLFSKYPSLTAREYSELSGTPRALAEQRLNEWTDAGKLKKLTTKNGSIWKRVVASVKQKRG